MRRSRGISVRASATNSSKPWGSLSAMYASTEASPSPLYSTRGGSSLEYEGLAKTAAFNRKNNILRAGSSAVKRASPDGLMRYSHFDFCIISGDGGYPSGGVASTPNAPPAVSQRMDRSPT